MPLPYPHPATLTDEALLAQCEATAGRGGGPGGQHRNKVSTLINLTHRPTGQQAHAGERRSQSENKSVALRRLRLALAVHIRTPPPPDTLPPLTGKTREDFLAVLDASVTGAGKPSRQCSELWRSRLGGTRAGSTGRIACNPDHHDYPALLAEAMDAIADHSWEPKPAAQRLGITPSQLIKLIKDHPPAMVEWNTQREKRGGHPLK